MKTIKYDNKYILPKTLSDNKLQKIVQFYLFECPVEGKSFRGKTFEEYGYYGASSFSKLKKVLLNAGTASLKKNYYPCAKNELEESFTICEKINYPDEYCVFLKWDERSIIRSMFAAIRNAIAHGSFNVKKYNRSDRIYFFSNYDGYEKARIVLYEETLLSWIKIIKNEE